jgi:enamine deaminase RidA (YjgF/YER057c/UK114 family)
MAAPKKKNRKVTKLAKKAPPARKVAPAKKAAPARKAAKPVRKAAKVTRKLISSGSAWEPIMGYSRAVRVGNVVHVSGTTGGDATDFYGQTKQALEKILAAVAPEGVKAEHAVRTRVFVTDISQWKEVARAHGEVFADIRPANSMVEVSALIDPTLLVEIEADFVIL